MNSQDIPRTLAPFFQEYTFENLDAERDWELVIERTLAYGNRDELRWLFGRYGRERVTDWVRRMGARRLLKQRLLLWQFMLEIPDCEIIKRPHGIWQH